MEQVIKISFIFIVLLNQHEKIDLSYKLIDCKVKKRSIYLCNITFLCRLENYYIGNIK